MLWISTHLHSWSSWEKLRIFSMFMTFAKFSLPWHQILWYGWHDLNCYARISMHFPYNNFFGLTNSDRKQNENRIKLLSSLVVFSKWHNITSVSTLFSPFIFYCSRLAVASGVINERDREKQASCLYDAAIAYLEKNCIGWWPDDPALKLESSTLFISYTIIVLPSKK